VTPQVWLIKRNGNGNLSYNEADGCTQLLVNDNYDGQTLSTITDVIIGNLHSFSQSFARFF